MKKGCTGSPGAAAYGFNETVVLPAPFSFAGGGDDEEEVVLDLGGDRPLRSSKEAQEVEETGFALFWPLLSLSRGVGLMVGVFRVNFDVMRNFRVRGSVRTAGELEERKSISSTIIGASWLLDGESDIAGEG